MAGYPRTGERFTGHREPCQSPSGPHSQEYSFDTSQATMGSTEEWLSNDESGRDGELCEGYDYEFVPQPDKKYECAICLQVLRSPHQTQCGHRFCKFCIYRWLNHMNEVGPKCPVCTEQINPQQLFEDRFANREILQFKVKCPNSKHGCSLELELKQVENHRSQCAYEEVSCPQGCSKFLRRHEVSQHLQQECTQRLAVCRWCQGQVLYFEKQVHESKCGDILISCKSCQRPLQRKQMAEHTKIGCEKDVKPCIFTQLGCESKSLPLSEITQHNESCTQYHLQLVASALNQILTQHGVPVHVSQAGTNGALLEVTPGMRHLEIGQRSREIPPLARENSHDFTTDRMPTTPAYRHQLSSSRSSWNSLDTICKERDHPSAPTQTGTKGPDNRYANIPGRLLSSVSREDPIFQEKESLSSTKGRSASHDRVFSVPSTPDPFTEVQDLTERSKNQDSRLALQEQQILELKAKVSKLESLVKEQSTQLSQYNDSRSLEPRLCNGVYIWRIQEFTRQRHEAAQSANSAAVLHSAGFYTSFYGYKLCLRVNLNGVEGGSGTHVSVFIHFMQGEFDDLLEWPFKGRITLSILDQGSEKIHITETLEPKPGLAAFQRPHSKRNHKGFGYIEFAPLRLLERSNFLLHDTLVVKAEVTESPKT